MANFLNYRNIDFKVNDSVFYADQINLSAQASVSPVVLDDGTLLNYAPDSAVVGSLNFDFYLTSAIPSFLNVTGTDESAVKISFAGIEIDRCYVKNLSFNVEPFQPILFSAEFDWYGDVGLENFESQSEGERKAKSVPNYIAHAYDSSIDKDNLDIGNIISFSYQSSCERPAFFNVDSLVPFRVAKLNKFCEVGLSSNNLGDMIKINGKNAQTSVSIKDFYGTLIETFNVSGIMSRQNYSVSNNSYLLSETSIEQTIAEPKTLV